MLNKKCEMLLLHLILHLCFLIVLPSLALAQECVYLTPFYGFQGDQNLEVEIHALDATFVQGDTQVSIDNTGITVVDTTVDNSTLVTVTIDIADDATIGSFNVTVTTGSEVMECEVAGETNYPKNFEVRQTVTVSVGYATGLTNTEDVPIPINLKNPYGAVVGSQIDICDPDNYLSYSDPITVELTDRTSDFSLLTSIPFEEIPEGCFRVILLDEMGNAKIEVGEGPILNVNYDVSRNAPTGNCTESISLLDVKISGIIDIADGTVKRDLKVKKEQGQFCFGDSTPQTSTTTTVPTDGGGGNGGGGGGGGGGGSPTTTIIPDISGDTTSTTTSVVEPPPGTTTTTSIEEETTSTTTTRKFLWPLAYEKLWGGVHRERNLSVLRAFRDEVLLKNDLGREYVSLLYGNSIEIVMLLLQDSALQDRVRETVDELLPHIESILYGAETGLSKAEIAQMESFLNYCYTKALSPRLKKTVGKVRKDLMEGVLFKQFGISVHG